MGRFVVPEVSYVLVACLSAPASGCWQQLVVSVAYSLSCRTRGGYWAHSYCSVRLHLSSPHGLSPAGSVLMPAALLVRCGGRLLSCMAEENERKMRLEGSFWAASAQRNQERTLGMERRDVAVVVPSSLSQGYNGEIQMNVLKGATTMICLRT